MLAASSSVAMLALAGCAGGDDEDDDVADDGDDQIADDGDDQMDDTGDALDELQEVIVLAESASGDDFGDNGLTSHAIDHACGHMEFDEPEPLAGGATEADASHFSDTHQPFAVEFDSETAYLLFESDDDYDHDHDEEVSTFDIIDRSADEVTADVHDDHWHGSLPNVPEGDNISLGAYIEDDHGDEIELDGDHYELGVALADGAPEGIVSFDYHGDHVHIIGEDEGMTEVVFELIHDGHTDYETPSIPVEVVHDHDDAQDDHGHDDGHDHDEEVGAFEVIDRSDDDTPAYVDGDHWHGDLPDVPEGDNISLGAYIEDDHGDEIELDGDHYELGVELADGAHEDVVSFDYHGDHVHIIGEEEGHTDVVFELIHDGHTDYETPPIGVDVVHDHGHDDDHDHGHGDEVGTFDIIDRSTDEVTADIHGDHWHGDLPDVPEGDNISLGAYIEDDHGDEIELDGDHYELGVELVDGAHEDVVSFDYHGDHVHIIGEEDGHTDVVFQLIHDGHTDYETPPIGVDVVHDDHSHDDDHDDDHEHDGEYYGFFTEEGEVSVLRGEKLHEEHGVEGCGDIGMYVVVDPDHGEVMLEITPE